MLMGEIGSTNRVAHLAFALRRTLTRHFAWGEIRARGVTTKVGNEILRGRGVSIPFRIPHDGRKDRES